MAQRIDFYFDYLSPYAYLAWTQIHGLALDLDAYVEPRPILFAALLNHHGQKGPAEIPAKRSYIMRDVLRTAAVLEEPLSPPPNHPFNPLLALRASMVEMPDEQRHALIDHEEVGIDKLVDAYPPTQDLAEERLGFTDHGLA